MRVLSLFDGISCGRVALTAANIPPNVYYASEVDKYAMTVAQANHPTTIQVGDVRVVRQMCEAGVFGKIDMLIGGSPCQNLSFAGKQKGLSTKEGVEITTLEQYKQLVSEGFEFEGQSYLFWEYVWIRELLQPTWWLLENVKMNKKWLQVFNDIMGVEGVLINSALVSAQNRQRYYWCNWPVSQPEDRGILLRDVIEVGEVDREKSYCIDANYYKGGSLKNYMEKARRQIVLSPEKLGNVNPSGRGMNGEVYGVDGKSPTLTTNKGEGSKIALQTDEARLMVRENVTGCRMVGRKLNPETGKRDDYNTELTASQRIETREDGKAGCVTTVYKDSMVANTPVQINPDKSCGGRQPHMQDRVYHPDGKSVALSATFSDRLNVGESVDCGITYRKLTPVECERLQGLPDQYTAHVSNSQRYKMLGNGWQVDTIIHIFECLKQWASVLGVKL